MTTYQYPVIEAVVRGLEAVWEGARVLIWQVVEREPRLVVTGHCRTSDMEAALATWRCKWRHFERGTPWQGLHAVYHPVLDDEHGLVGFVQGMDGTCGLPESPELSAYINTRLRVLAGTLAHAQPEERECSPAQAASAVVTVLASSDSAETERAKTVAALVRSEWNATRAARLLGIARQSVCRRMKRMTIARPEPSPFDPRRRKVRNSPA